MKYLAIAILLSVLTFVGMAVTGAPSGDLIGFGACAWLLDTAGVAILALTEDD